MTSSIYIYVCVYIYVYIVYIYTSFWFFCRRIWCASPIPALLWASGLNRAPYDLLWCDIFSLALQLAEISLGSCPFHRLPVFDFKHFAGDFIDLENDNPQELTRKCLQFNEYYYTQIVTPLLEDLGATGPEVNEGIKQLIERLFDTERTADEKLQFMGRSVWIYMG